MRGKEKCRALKEIRKSIAEKNDIAFAVEECTHQGECRGTCPRCESELRYLERELDKKRKLGQAVALVGISAGVAFTTTGCIGADIVNAGIDTVESILDINQTSGVAEMPSEEREPLGGDVEIESEEPLGGEVADPAYEDDSECPVSESDIIELEGDVEYIPEEEESEPDEDAYDEDAYDTNRPYDGPTIMGIAPMPED